MIKKLVLGLGLFSTLVVSVTGQAEVERQKKLVVKCTGQFYVASGGTHGGGYSYGSSTIKIFRNKVDGRAWYSAEVSASGDPTNRGVIIRGYDYETVTRTYHPSFEEPHVATSFKWESKPGDEKEEAFFLSIPLSTSPFLYPVARYSIGENTFNPSSQQCVWQPGEDL